VLKCGGNHKMFFIKGDKLYWTADEMGISFASQSFHT
jgi:hypothetical protein